MRLPSFRCVSHHRSPSDPQAGASSEDRIFCVTPLRIPLEGGGEHWQKAALSVPADRAGALQGVT